MTSSTRDEELKIVEEITRKLQEAIESSGASGEQHARTAMREIEEQLARVREQATRQGARLGSNSVIRMTPRLENGRLIIPDAQREELDTRLEALESELDDRLASLEDQMEDRWEKMERTFDRMFERVEELLEKTERRGD